MKSKILATIFMLIALTGVIFFVMFMTACDENDVNSYYPVCNQNPSICPP